MSFLSFPPNDWWQGLTPTPRVEGYVLGSPSCPLLLAVGLEKPLRQSVKLCRVLRRVQWADTGTAHRNQNCVVCRTWQHPQRVCSEPVILQLHVTFCPTVLHSHITLSPMTEPFSTDTHISCFHFFATKMRNRYLCNHPSMCEYSLNINF